MARGKGRSYPRMEALGVPRGRRTTMSESLGRLAVVERERSWIWGRGARHADRTAERRSIGDNLAAIFESSLGLSDRDGP